jgi:hypothetical protein
MMPQYRVNIVFDPGIILFIGRASYLFLESACFGDAETIG